MQLHTPTMQVSTGFKVQAIHSKQQCMSPKLVQANAAMDDTEFGQQIMRKLEHFPRDYIRAATAVHCTRQMQCMYPRYHAMQCHTRAGKSNQQGCLTAPGKVQLRLDAIQCYHNGHAPCYTVQPDQVLRQNIHLQVGTCMATIQSMQHATTADGCNYNFANDCWYHTSVNNHNCHFSASATASNGNQHMPTHTTVGRCQHRCRFLRGSSANADETRHSNTGGTQLQIRVQSKQQGHANANASAMQM